MTDPIVIERTIPRERHEVWTLCTTAAGLSQWWWPHLPDATYQIDPRPAHTYRFASQQAGIVVHGDYFVVEKAEALEFSWVWEDQAPSRAPQVSVETQAPVGSPIADHVRITFRQAGGHTSVRLTHTMTEPTSSGRADYTDYWNDYLDRLAELR